MNAALTKFKPVIMALAGLAVLWGIYSFGGRVNVNQNATLRAEQVREKAQKLDEDLLAQLRDIKQISLDGSIFSSPEWDKLVDYSRPLGEPVRGRPDPFSKLVTPVR